MGVFFEAAQRKAKAPHGFAPRAAHQYSKARGLLVWWPSAAKSTNSRRLRKARWISFTWRRAEEMAKPRPCR